MHVATNSVEAGNLIANAMLDPKLRLEVKDGVIQTSAKTSPWTDADIQEVVLTYIQMTHQETQVVPESLKDRAIKLVPPNYDFSTVIEKLSQGLKQAGTATAIDQGLDSLHAVQASLPRSVHNYHDIQLRAQLHDINQLIVNIESNTRPHSHENMWRLLDAYVTLKHAETDLLEGTLTPIPAWQQFAIENGKTLSPKQRAEFIAQMANKLIQMARQEATHMGNNDADFEAYLKAANTEHLKVKQAQEAFEAEALKAELQAQLASASKAPSSQPTPSAGEPMSVDRT